MYKSICLAGGCFWGVEEYFRLLKGVTATEVGYANGNTSAFPNPTYELLCVGNTGYAEACKLEYDNSLSLETILNHLFLIIDPTALNKQGNDVGSQYRTGIYWSNSADEPAVRSFLALQQESSQKPIVVEALQLTSYHKAEEYHQKYLVKNPGGYCHIPKYMYDNLK